MSSHLSFLFVKLTNRVGQSVWPEDDACALWPLRAHQAVFAHQNLSNVFRPSHSNDRFSQEMRFKNISIFLSTSHMKI